MTRPENSAAGGWDFGLRLRTIVNLSVVLPMPLSVVWFGDAFALAKALGAPLTVLSIVLIGRGASRTGKEGRASFWSASF